MRHAILSAAFLATTILLQAAEPAGVHHQTVGKLEVISLLDGDISLPINVLQGIEAAEAKRMLGGKDTAATSVNAFLIRTPGKTVLVDTGIGGDSKGSTGHLLEHLQAAGVDPAQVDLVLITHFHFDHIGGLVKTDGSRAFPKAIVRVSQVENDFWLGDSSKLPERLRSNVTDIKAALAPYQAAGAYRPFAPGEELGKGIRTLPSAGHTAGHTVFVFSSEGKELWCIGDLIHFGDIQFERPKVSLTYDTDSKKAVAARRDFFQQAAASGAVLAAAHLAFPGTVQLKTKGESFVATPVK